MQLKNMLKKAVYGVKSDSESYIEHLKAIGMKIGDDCVVYVTVNNSDYLQKARKYGHFTGYKN